MGYLLLHLRIQHILSKFSSLANINLFRLFSNALAFEKSQHYLALPNQQRLLIMTSYCQMIKGMLIIFEVVLVAEALSKPSTDLP